MALSVSNQFQKKQVIESAKVNTNFNEIVDYVNDLETSVSDGTGIADGSITEPKLASNSVTNAKLTDDCVTSVELRDDAVTDGNRAVTTNHIRDAAVTEAKIATSVAGSGLSGGGGSALAVNVDNSTIEISTDTLQLKDGGTTETKLATAVQTKLGQNIGLVARVSDANTSTSFEDVVNYTGQGQLLGICSVHSSTGVNAEIRITIDGTGLGTYAFGVSNQGDIIELNAGNSTTMFKVTDATFGNLNELRVHFRTSLRIEHRLTTATGTLTTYVAYEQQQ